MPYIPGSSLRGKLRSLLEQTSGWPSRPSWSIFPSARDRKCASTRATVPTTRSACCSAAIPDAWSACSGEALDSSTPRPARLAVYDAPLDPDSITPQMRENLDDELTEVKSENAIDRITSQANPRTLERVPAGARFRIAHGAGRALRGGHGAVAAPGRRLRLLEDDALGGGGSRGSGRVRLSDLKLTWRSKAFYASGAGEETLATAADVGALQTAVTDSAFAAKLA